MLIRFRVQNFLSFKEEVELSMVAGKVQKHPDHIVKSPLKPSVDLLRVGLVYGANASGKSNLIKAIHFGKFMVTTGVRAKALIPRKPFKLDGECLSQPSRFEYEFRYKGTSYIYGFLLDSKYIHEEWLIEIRSASEKELFRRISTIDNNEIKFNIKVTKEDTSLLKLVALGTPTNRLFLQECTERNIKFFKNVYDWFSDALIVIFPTTIHTLVPLTMGNENEFGKKLIENLIRFNTGVCGYRLQQVPLDSPDLPQDLIEEMEQSLVEGEGISLQSRKNKRFFIKKESEELHVYKLVLYHKDRDCESDVEFEMDEESDGTNRLLDLLPLLFSRKGNSEKVYFIDELDRSLHPNLSHNFLSTFLENRKEDQIIVTTHESSLLDLDFVRRDEIWFVEKNNNGSSMLYSLEEFSPRYDKDIRKGYMLGRFGAIPIIGHPNFSED